MEIKGDDGNPSCLPAWEAIGMTEGYGHFWLSLTSLMLLESVKT